MNKLPALHVLLVFLIPVGATAQNAGSSTKGTAGISTTPATMSPARPQSASGGDSVASGGGAWLPSMGGQLPSGQIDLSGAIGSPTEPTAPPPTTPPPSYTYIEGVWANKAQPSKLMPMAARFVSYFSPSCQVLTDITYRILIRSDGAKFYRKQASIATRDPWAPIPATNACPTVADGNGSAYPRDSTDDLPPE